MELGRNEREDVGLVSIDEEIVRLRERVAELEGELFEVSARTNAIVAETQERVYWLDRWRIDLNHAMETRGGKLFRAAMGTAGGLKHRAHKLKKYFSKR